MGVVICGGKVGIIAIFGGVLDFGEYQLTGTGPWNAGTWNVSHFPS